MMLPGMELQVVYARLAWGVVLAAVVACAWRRKRHPGTGRGLAALALSSAVMWLPGPLSPAYWLGLAFQSPSGLLVALCSAGLFRQLGPTPRAARPLLEPRLALALATGGALLYADATGWLTLGLYANGFAPVLSPAVGLLVGLLGTALVVTGSKPETGVALLASAALYAFFRLPTGNVLDALIDPFLWGWALWCLARRASEAIRARRRSPAPAS